MSKETIAERSNLIRNEQNPEGNTKARIADQFDDINESKLEAPAGSGFYYLTTGGIAPSWSPINPSSYYLLTWNGSGFQSTNIYYNQDTQRVGIGTGNVALNYLLEVNGSAKVSTLLISNPTNAQGDSTFTKSIVAKPDGTIGWEDKAPSPGEYVEKQAFVAEYNKTSDYLTIGFMLRSKYSNISLPTVNKIFIAIHAYNISSGERTLGSGHDLTSSAVLKWGYGPSMSHESGNKGLLTGTVRIPSISSEITYLQGFGYIPIQVTVMLNVTINGVSKDVLFSAPFM